MTKYDDVCDNIIKKILNELLESKIVILNNQDYERYHNRIFNICIKSLFSILDFYEVQFEYLLGNTYLFAYAFFLDSAIDLMDDEMYKKVENLQASTYLLLKYKKFLSSYYPAEYEKIFDSYFIRQSRYLIMEKQNINEDLVKTNFISKNNLIEKQILLMFPLELLKFNIKNLQFDKIYEFYTYYYSYILLIDDIMDFEFDIESKCITYPIALYYNKYRKMPKDNNCIKSLHKDLLNLLQIFKLNILNVAENGYHGICLNYINKMEKKINLTPVV